MQKLTLLCSFKIYVAHANRRHCLGAVVAAFLFGLMSSAQAQNIMTEPAKRGMQEIVISVRDFDASLKNLLDISGWTVRFEGDVDPALLEVWGLSSKTRARQAVIGNPSHDIGLLRVVAFSGVPQVEIRSSARPFDTGGMFNIDVLVHDMDAVFARMQERGYQGYADPSRYIFMNKPFIGAILRGQDGILFNLLARGDGNYDNVPPFTLMSHIPNSTQMVSDWDRSKHFFEEQLGWHFKWGGSPAWQPDGANNFSLPNSLVMEGRSNGLAASFAFDKDADGATLEIFNFEGIRSIDYSTRAKPPNLGLLMYTIMVPDLPAYLAKISAKGVIPLAPPRDIALAPYGKGRAAVIVSPDGVWMMLVDRPGAHK